VEGDVVLGVVVVVENGVVLILPLGALEEGASVLVLVPRYQNGFRGAALATITVIMVVIMVVQIIKHVEVIMVGEKSAGSGTISFKSRARGVTM